MCKMFLTHSLYTKHLAATGTVCVRFAYYIQGIGSDLRVYPVRTGPHWPFFNVTGKQVGQWRTTATTTTGFKYNDRVNNGQFPLHYSYIVYMYTTEMLFSQCIF